MPSLFVLRRFVLDRWLFDWRQRGVDRLGWPELQVLQERRLRALLTFVVERSPFYARLYRGIDVTRASLAELPTVDKAALMENWDDVVTDRRLRRSEVEAFIQHPDNLGRFYRGRYPVGFSSGTAGTQGLFIWGGAEGPWRTFAARRAARMQRDRSSHRPAALVPHANTSMAYQIRRALEPWTRTLDLLAPTAQLVEALNDYQPDSLTGFAHQLEILAHEQLAGRLRISPHTVLSRGEVLTPEARATIEQAWGAPVRDAYGAAEVGPIAAQCTAGELMHVFEDVVVLETEAQGHGGAAAELDGGTVLLTSLIARTFPIIRYRIGDRAEMADGSCPCGRSFRLLRHLYGRDYGLLWFRRPDGTWTPLHWGPFEVTIKAWPQVHRYQLRHEPHGTTLLVVPVGGTDMDAAQIERDLRVLLEAQGVVPPPLQVRAVDEVEIRRRSGGKLISYVALVKPPQP